MVRVLRIAGFGRIGAAAVALALAAPIAAEARESCFNILHKEASTECQVPYVCACPGGSLEFSRVQVSGVTFAGKGSGGETANCCRTLISIPAHDQLGSGPFEVHKITTVPAILQTSECELDCTSVLFGLAAWGTATCSYSGGSQFGAYSLYMQAGVCPLDEE